MADNGRSRQIADCLVVVVVVVVVAAAIVIIINICKTHNVTINHAHNNVF